jgi:hypothetical protein
MTKGQVIFGVGSVLLVSGIVYFGFIKKYQNGLTWYQDVTGGTGDNFEMVKKNLGGSYPEGAVASAKFDANKYQADFYNNGRVIIAKVGANGYLVKGSYRDGGLTIVLDNGKTISSGSVWGNLLETVK